jgi:1,4-dihydroxy-2-naphthoyl-CoA hydrolase
VTVAIWHTRPAVAELNALHAGTAVSRLGIEMSEVGDDYLKATMPVDERTRQPFGLLHGGAAALLAETLASAAGTFCIDTARQLCVGLEINCNHVRGMREGVVTGTARPLHLGGRTQVWEIRIEDAQGRLVSVARMTATVVDRDPAFRSAARSAT